MATEPTGEVRGSPVPNLQIISDQEWVPQATVIQQSGLSRTTLFELRRNNVLKFGEHWKRGNDAKGIFYHVANFNAVLEWRQHTR